MDCLACHTPNTDGARFCAKCGAPLPVPKSANDDPLIGVTVGGRYRITGVLGEGGMGRVYTGEQQMGTRVRKAAVKTLLSQFAKDPQTVGRFMREVGTVSELEHPNTIKVYDFGQIEGSGELYIAMELLEGQSLEQILATGQPMPPERVDRILGQVCGSLQEAHDKGIVHRDLKPANIFLTTRAGEEDVVKVLDFGIAKRDSKDTKTEQKLTQQGTILGTPPYMSPEQFTGKELDARSDIYSLGILTYEMLTGRLPLDADTPWQWMTQHMSAQPYPFESVPQAANVPQKMRHAVMRALGKSTADRPQSAREFFEELTLGATRMSMVGLGSGGIAAMPPPAGGTSMMAAPAGGGGRGASTQIGEPLFAPGPTAPGGARTMGGFDPNAPPGYAPGVPTGGGQTYPSPPQRKSGGSGMIIAAVVGVLALAGGVGGFLLYNSSKSSDDDGDTKKTSEPTKDDDSPSGDNPPSAKPTEKPVPSAKPTEKPVPSAKPSALPSAVPTAPEEKDYKPIDDCCSHQRNPSDKKLCDSLNKAIKEKKVERPRALATLKQQGVKCRG